MSAPQILFDTFSDIEMRVFIKIGVMFNQSAGLIHSNLKKLLPNKCPSDRTVQRWAKRFKDGDPSVKIEKGGSTPDDHLRSERLSRIQAALDHSRNWCVRSLASYTGIPKTTLHELMKNEFKLTKKHGKWVPHLLTQDQKDMRCFACQSNLQFYRKTKTLLERTITIDETWVSLYMAPNKDQSAQWLFPGEQPQQVVAQNIHQEKRMLIMAMDFNGIAFYGLLPQKTTVTGEVYTSFLREKMLPYVGRRNAEKVWLLHDNARPHRAAVVREFLQDKEITLWSHPPYSPDISPLDLNCFHLLKRGLKGIHHQNWNEFERALEVVVRDLNGRGLMDGIKRLPERWQRVINAEGEYI